MIRRQVGLQATTHVYPWTQHVMFVDPETGATKNVVSQPNVYTTWSSMLVPAVPAAKWHLFSCHVSVTRESVLSALRLILQVVLSSEPDLVRMLCDTDPAQLLAMGTAAEFGSPIGQLLFWGVATGSDAAALADAPQRGENLIGVVLEQMRTKLVWEPTSSKPLVDRAVADEAPSGRGASFLFRRQVLPGYGSPAGGTQFARQGAVAFQLSNAVVVHGGTGFHSTAHVRMYFPSTGRVAVRVNDGSWPLLTNHFAVRVWGHRVVLLANRTGSPTPGVNVLWEVSGRSVHSMRCVKRDVTRGEGVPAETRVVAATTSPWGDVLALTALGTVMRLHVTASGYHWEKFSTLCGDSCPWDMECRSASLVVLGSLLVLHGGMLRGSRSNTTWVMPLEPASHRRWCKAPLVPGSTVPLGRSHHVGTVADGRLWVWGGIGRMNTHVDDTAWCASIVEQDSAAVMSAAGGTSSDSVVHDAVMGTRWKTEAGVAPRFLVSWTKHSLTSSLQSHVRRRGAPPPVVRPVFTKFGGGAVIVVGGMLPSATTGSVPSAMLEVVSAWVSVLCRAKARQRVCIAVAWGR